MRSATPLQGEILFSQSPTTFFQDTNVVRWDGADWFAAVTAVQPRGTVPFDRDAQLSIYRWAHRHWVLAARLAMTPQVQPALVGTLSEVEFDAAGTPGFIVSFGGMGVGVRPLEVVSPIGGRWQKIRFDDGLGEQVCANGTWSGNGLASQRS